MRKHVMIGAFAAGALVMVAAGDASPCGGCFIRPSSQSGTVVTDHRMVFSVSPTQTTLYDQIEYTGSPADFAWVLPIVGQVGLGVSSDLLFTALDQATQTTILAPPYPCPVRQAPPPALNAGASGSSGGSSGGTGGGVTVIAQEVVGPYDTVQLHPNSKTDTAALTAWLQTNGYAIPTSIDATIGAYVMEGFDFLAVKLVPGAGVQAMRPLSVTTSGAALSLPLRMVAAGTGATVGITLWVVATGRYEPSNFGTFTIDPSSIVWDWSTSSSNYTTLRADKEAQLGNAAWQIESSLDVSPYQIEQTVLSDPTASAYAAAPGADGGAGATALEVRSQDLNTLFPEGNASVRITRMRADLGQSALKTDLVLKASSSQTALSNYYQSVLSVNANCQTSGGSVGGTDFGTGPNGGQYSAGDAGTFGGGGTGLPPTPRSVGGGCSASAARPENGGFFSLGAAFAGALILRLRRPRRPR